MISAAKLGDGMVTFDSVAMFKIFWATRNIYFVHDVKDSLLEIVINRIWDANNF